MANNDDLAPSPLDLPPSPPPSSPPPSSLPPQAHSTNPSFTPSRPIPIEIYNHILHFAFGRHLPPLPLEDRLDEPPSLSPLLPLTLVSKGLRELVLPFLYHHLVVRRGEDWIQLLDPMKGLLVGGREEETRRRGWVKKLSFARDRFPVSSWTPSKDQPATMDPRPKPNMASLDFSGLGDLEEVYVGDWGRDDVVHREIKAAVDVEMAGGPYRDSLENGGRSQHDLVSLGIDSFVYLTRSARQDSSILHLLSQTDPTSIHASLDPFTAETHAISTVKPLRIVLHPPQYEYQTKSAAVKDLLDWLKEFSDNFPSSRFNLDLVTKPRFGRTKKQLVSSIVSGGWTKDEAGWWTRA